MKQNDRNILKLPKLFQGHTVLMYYAFSVLTSENYGTLLYEIQFCPFIIVPQAYRKYKRNAI